MKLTDEQRKANALTEEWLKSVGFKWHQLERQSDKQWLLWLGDAVREGNGFTSYSDLGIELTTNCNGKWHCWLRSDAGGIYSRFLHIRYLRTQQELIQLCEALTGQKWDPLNHLYGAMRTPEQADRIRKDDERLDRRIMFGNKWREIEKDDSIGGALPQHREEYEKKKLRDIS